RVLIVEDEFYISLHTRGLLQALGHVVVAGAGGGAQARGPAAQERPPPAVVGIRPPGTRDGTAAAEAIAERVRVGAVSFAPPPTPTTKRGAGPRPCGRLAFWKSR